MKKTERLRFYALIGKQSKGEILTAEENAELGKLSGLVSTHPNSATDTDDTSEDDDEGGAEEETEEEKKKREKEEADKNEQAKGNKAAAKPGVSARLSAALASLGGGQPAAVTAALQKAQKDLVKANSDLKAAQASLKSTQSALAGVCGFFGLTPADIVGKSETEIDAICTAKINAAATAQLSGLGIAPGRLPAPSTKAGADSKTLTKAEFDALTPHEKSKFSVAGGRISD